MKVEIIFRENQQDIVQKLKELLSHNVYPGFEPILINVQENIAKTMEQYHRLVRASFLDEIDPKISVMEYDHRGHRFYIDIETTIGSKRLSKRIHEDQSTWLFPAVAIHDRMVLISKKIRQELQSSPLPIILPDKFAKSDLNEVDFDNQAELAAVMEKISQTLRDEILTQLRARAKYVEPSDINLPQLAKEVGVELDYINSVLHIEASKRVFYRDLTCKLTPQAIQVGRYEKLSLSVTNNSKRDLSNLLVKISGPTLQPFEVLPKNIPPINVPAGQTQEISFSVMSQAKGNFPLAIIFALLDDKVLSDKLPPHHIWIECV